MDRYVIRERRPGVEYPQGNQMMAFSPSSATGNNITMPDAYYGACEPPVQRMGASFAHNSHLNQNIPNTPHFVPNNMLPNSTQMVSGIDPRYLAAYSGNNLPYITGQQIQHIGQVRHEQMFHPEAIAFGSNYQNRNLVPVEKHAAKPFAQPRIPASPRNENQRVEQPKTRTGGNYTTTKELGTPKTLVLTNSATTRKQSEVNLLKNEASQVRSRSEKLKALHKSGPRAFSGPVEKVLKWHKSLQDIGLLVFYEIVAKCISIRPGERCAKNIVVRDDNGPAIQVVYYEVDFLLPDLKPPCTVRVIGRMMPGTCRLHAFNVRLATGDDVATLPRRAAIAAHHVAKLNSEYGKDSDKITIIIP